MSQQRYRKHTYTIAVRVAKAERAVIRAAAGCIDKNGHAFTVATAELARTFFINEKAQKRLEQAVANLKEARRHRPIDSGKAP